MKSRVTLLVCLSLSTLLSACDDAPDSGPVACVAPVVPALTAIPDNPALVPSNSDVIVDFEVDGDAIVGKYVADAASGEAALTLWQELVLRVPTNQRLDLVELHVFRSSDPAGFMSGTTGSVTGRYGYTMSVTVDYFNERKPCDPLIPRRGNYSWTFIHEYSHMRSTIDGTLDMFTAEFGDIQGQESTYPSDGSPSLTGNFVTSYAERARGDEDYAESFTTYVMLATLPNQNTGAAKKVRWFHDHGFDDLRKAMRITQSDGSAAPIDAAPRASFPFTITPPSWILGTWHGVASNGVAIEYVFTSDNIVRKETPPNGTAVTTSYKNLRDGGVLATIAPYDNDERAYGYHVSVAGEGRTEYHYFDSATKFHSEIDSLGNVDFTKSP